MATRPELPIREIQADLAERGLDGWLLWDFRGQNPTAVAAVDLSGHMLTRRWAYLVPRQGEPVEVSLPFPKPHLLLSDCDLL